MSAGDTGGEIRGDRGNRALRARGPDLDLSQFLRRNVVELGNDKLLATAGGAREPVVVSWLPCALYSVFTLPRALPLAVSAAHAPWPRTSMGYPALVSGALAPRIFFSESSVPSYTMTLLFMVNTSSVSV